MLATAARAQAPPAVVATPTTPRDSAWVGVHYGVEGVSGIEAWQELAVEGGRPVRNATIIVRASRARRFGLSGTQLEAEVYPRLGRLTYLALGAAVSPTASVYPDSRLSAEAYRALPGGWEGSLGVRHIRSGGVSLSTYTGTVGRYVGNYWLSARPSVTSYRGGPARAITGVARRYFSGRFDYVSLSANTSAGADAAASDPQRLARPSDLHAWAVHVDRLQPWGRRLRLRYGAGIEREGLLLGGSRSHHTLMLGFDWVQ